MALTAPDASPDSESRPPVEPAIRAEAAHRGEPVAEVMARRDRDLQPEYRRRVAQIPELKQRIEALEQAAARPDEATVRETLRAAIDRILADCDESAVGVTFDAIEDTRRAIASFRRLFEPTLVLRLAAEALVEVLDALEDDELTDGELERLREVRPAIAGRFRLIGVASA